MSVVGIIAEYNPLHCGHEYHIKNARNLTGAEACVCVLSSNFVQRGEPGLVSKWARTKMALLSGADLVVELPSVFSCGSAEYFSAGAISILESLGFIDYLCFGSEKGEIEPLETAAQHLAFENEFFKEILRAGLQDGLSFAASRQNALKATLENDKNTIDIINKPNNILAVEYIKAIKRMGSKIKPLTIKRKGQGYNETAHHIDKHDFSSATSIRHYIEKMDDTSLCQHDSYILNSIPKPCIDVLCEEFRSGRGPVFLKSFGNTVLHLFRTMGVNSISRLPYMENGLENRMKDAAFESATVEEFVNKVVTKRYPASRVKRIIICALTGLTNDFLESLKSNGYAQYIRILGFNETGRRILSDNKKKVSLPIITKPASFSKMESNLASQLFQHEIRSTAAYVLGYPDKNLRYGNVELTTSPIRVI